MPNGKERLRMKVFVIGSHGQIGKLLVDLLVARGDEVVAAIRDEKQAPEMEERGAAVQTFDLMSQPDEMAKAIGNADAVVFTAGSGGATGYDQTLMIDLDGAVKSMLASKIAGVTRFVLVSAMNSENPEKWTEAIKPYYVAKYFADNYLENQTDLDYTIVKPGILTNEPGKGGVLIGEDHGSISRQDVAEVVAETLHHDNTIKKSFSVVEGAQPIAEGISDIQ